jgi:hypothetical protein
MMGFVSLNPSYKPHIHLPVILMCAPKARLEG